MASAKCAASSASASRSGPCRRRSAAGSPTASSAMTSPRMRKGTRAAGTASSAPHRAAHSAGASRPAPVAEGQTPRALRAGRRPVAGRAIGAAPSWTAQKIAPGPRRRTNRRAHGAPAGDARRRFQALGQAGQIFLAAQHGGPQRGEEAARLHQLGREQALGQRRGPAAGIAATHGAGEHGEDEQEQRQARE